MCVHGESEGFSGEPSMKVPPKRKGNARCEYYRHSLFEPSMKVPPKRKGNVANPRIAILQNPSMKVPPKRKGNQKQKCERTPY